MWRKMSFLLLLFSFFFHLADTQASRQAGSLMAEEWPTSFSFDIFVIASVYWPPMLPPPSSSSTTISFLHQRAINSIDHHCLPLPSLPLLANLLPPNYNYFSLLFLFYSATHTHFLPLYLCALPHTHTEGSEDFTNYQTCHRLGGELLLSDRQRAQFLLWSKLKKTSRVSAVKWTACACVLNGLSVHASSIEQPVGSPTNYTSTTRPSSTLLSSLIEDGHDRWRQ